MSRRSQQALPGLGAKVTVQFGGRDVEAEVIEHRGPIGVGGRHLLRVRVQVDEANAVEFELPATDVVEIAA